MLIFVKQAKEKPQKQIDVFSISKHIVNLESSSVETHCLHTYTNLSNIQLYNITKLVVPYPAIKCTPVLHVGMQNGNFKRVIWSDITLIAVFSLTTLKTVEVCRMKAYKKWRAKNIKLEHGKSQHARVWESTLNQWGNPAYRIEEHKRSSGTNPVWTGCEKGEGSFRRNTLLSTPPPYPHPPSLPHTLRLLKLGEKKKAHQIIKLQLV